MKRRFATALLAAAIASPALAEEPAHAENSGQDPTQPVTRVDVRLKYVEGSDGAESQVFTLRADKPFMLGDWKLSTRIDAPFVRNDVPSGDNPGGDWEMGLSDMLIQGLLLAPSKGKWTFGFGGQVLLPTAVEDQFGSGKYQLVPTVLAVRQIPSISPGTFAGVLVRDKFSVGGDDDRPVINELSVQGLLNIALKDRWFVTLAPEAKFNMKDGGDMFLPFDITVGRKLSKRVVASVQADWALIDDYPQYDWQVEGRIGVFF